MNCTLPASSNGLMRACLSRSFAGSVSLVSLSPTSGARFVGMEHSDAGKFRWLEAVYNKSREDKHPFKSHNEKN